MTTVQIIAGSVAGVVASVAYIPYLLAVARGTTKPNVATWFIWAGVGALLVASYWAAGARTSIWVPLSCFLGPLVTAFVSLRYGEAAFSRFDLLCIAAAAASVVLWILSGNPVVALILNVVIDGLGALPTVRKSWTSPESEDRTAWALFCAANAINFIAIEAWTIAGALYPIYLFLMTLGMNVLIWRPRRVAAAP